MISKPYLTITSSLVDGIPEIKISGKLTAISEPELKRDLSSNLDGLKGIKFLLVDIRDMEGRPGIVSTYYRVRECPYYNLFKKVAIIDRIENRDYSSFHETTAINAGYNIHYFNDKDKALMWLKNDSDKLKNMNTISPRLFILSGGGRYESYVLEEGKSYTIGRHSGNDIRLNDIHVSRHHLRVRFKDERYYIKDMVTKNGTFAGGEDIERGVEVEVRKGIPVVIGMTVIGFGEEFEASSMPFLISAGIFVEVDDDGEVIKPYRSMTVRNNLACIYNVDKALSRSKDTNEIMEILLDNIFDLLKRIDRCAVILYDDTKDEISRVGYRSRRPDDVAGEVYNKDLVMQSLAMNKAIMIRDVYDDNYEDSALTKSLRIMKIGSAACVPICTYFNTKGAIYVDSIERPKGFRKNDLAILKDIGNRAALAMDEKKLYH